MVNGASARGVQLGWAADFESLTGKGVRATIDGRSVALGNQALMTHLGVDVAAVTERAEALRAEGETAMYVAVDGKAAGLVGVADPIKESTPEAIRALHAEGIRIVMLTGDAASQALDAVHKARQDYLEDLQNAWRGDKHKPLVLPCHVEQTLACLCVALALRPFPELCGQLAIMRQALAVGHASGCLSQAVHRERCVEVHTLRQAHRRVNRSDTRPRFSSREGIDCL